MDSDRAPWIIGGVAAAFIACVAALVCAAAFFLMLGFTGSRQALTSPVTTLAMPVTAVAPPPQQGGVTIIDVDEDDDPSLGPADAPVVIVMFSDFECPFCKRFRDGTLDQLMKEYDGQIRLVYRDFPLTSIHPQAMNAAMAAECADDQGQFWAMHDLLFENQDQFSDTLYPTLAAQLQLDQQQFETCFDTASPQDEIEHDIAQGELYGVTGTPTFFINGRMVVGAQPISAYEAAIDAALSAP